jgi:hypothetical protein
MNVFSGSPHRIGDIMRNSYLWALLTCAAATGAVDAQTFEITIAAGKHDLKNVPICVPLSLTKEQAQNSPTPVLAGGGLTGINCQLTAPGVTTESIPPSEKGLVRRDLHVILPALKAGATFKLTGKLGDLNEVVGPYSWQDTKDGSDTLSFNPGDGKPRPVLRYMHAPYDKSTSARRNRTYKVFHHLYDPTGKRLVTNGGHTDAYDDEKKLLYPHHRGLMYAFNKISYGEDLKSRADTWHAQPGDTHQAHVKMVSEEAGPVLGRHRVLISWQGAKSDVFAHEERELTVYNVPGGTLVEFASKLKTAGGTVKLDGDPQHAGFQFRAANEVAEKTANQTYYLRPDGKGELGATRNWDPKAKGPVNLPWDAMSFVVGGQRYTACYLNSPRNPRESRWSERDYGRFGCYFEYELTAEHPLVINYRVWLQDGEMTGEQVQALYEAFAEPPEVATKK